MDAPQGRYKVIEKDGRLIVIDNATGQPASGTTPPPRPGGAPMGGPARPAASGGSPVSAASGSFAAWIDGIGAALLRLAVSEWDDQGRAVIHWSLKVNDREQRWDAGLDPDEQRRLGRALAAIGTLPFFLVLFIFGSGGWMFVPLALTAVPVVWGGISIAKLRDETNQWRLPPE